MESKHIFRDITGEWPDSSWNIATTPNVQITRAVLNKISRATSHTRNLSGRARHGEMTRIESAISFIPAIDRELWVEIGMAVKSELGEAGLDLWDSRSGRQSLIGRSRPKPPGGPSGRPDGITPWPLYHHAKAHGWRETVSLQPLSARQIAERGRRVHREAAAAGIKKRKREHAMKGSLRRSGSASWPTIHTLASKGFPDARWWMRMAQCSVPMRDCLSGNRLAW